MTENPTPHIPTPSVPKPSIPTPSIPKPTLPNPPKNPQRPNKQKKFAKKHRPDTPKQVQEQPSTELPKKATRGPRQDWKVRGKKGVVTIKARSEIEAVKIFTDTYGEIPESAKKDYVRPEHLTDRPLANNEALKNLKSVLGQNQK